MRKQRKSRKFKVRMLVLAIKAALVASIVFTVIGGLYVFASSNVFAIRKVDIRGNKHLSESELLGIMRVARGDNLLMSSSESIYDRLHSSPWIKRVSLRKDLPGTLIVMLEETEPQALVRRKNAFVIVDGDGVELERVHGRQERFLPLISSFETGESDEFREALRLATVINDSGIAKRARSVEIFGMEGDVKELAVRIDGMEIKVGEGSYEKKLARLFELIDEIRSRPIKVDYIDLRFANRVIVKPVAEAIQ